ncbi:MAG TPA: enoyl-CoA hydratase/isomerase family protein [Burkholderiales bacterium]|nr:enoyl-CoA hydratase/isomerase family protein [Burkholderiales bacterium]
MSTIPQRPTPAMKNAVIDDGAVAAWQRSAPADIGDFSGDCTRYSQFWLAGDALLAALPPRPDRNESQSALADSVKRFARDSRTRFLAAHAASVYDRLTRNRTRFVRVQQLIYDAAALLPGLVPTRARVDAESTLMLRDKEGVEVDQGLFVSAVLADTRAGTHLCHAMLLPRPEAAELLPEFARTGRLSLEGADLVRRGRAAHLIQKNPRHLNAEDDDTIDAAEIAADVALLDPQIQIGVLRGDPVQGGKYDGLRMLGSGINLTHLYYGKIPYIWYLQRDLGIVNKLFRGIASEDAVPDDVSGVTTEKPWIAVVEQFAIGGHCQYLLAMDYVLAAKGAFMTLPARKEGIIPGAANMRLPRFTGERIAREAILYERRLDCDSPEGRMICNEIVAPADMDAAIDRVVENFTGSGIVSAASNRRVMRVSQEPLDVFRRYFAAYARDQAYCHFSPALIANLERHWNARSRKL